jgi:hypothetical protein
MQSNNANLYKWNDEILLCAGTLFSKICIGVERNRQNHFIFCNKWDNDKHNMLIYDS